MLRMAHYCLLQVEPQASASLQVETPVLETSAGGADARPFTTFHNALQQPYALRIATGASLVAGFLPNPEDKVRHVEERKKVVQL